MKAYILPSLRLTLACALLCCAAYPAAIWLLAQLAPGQGAGRLVEAQGREMYENVAQAFSSERYFWPRPSAAHYNAAAAAGSNQGPSNPAHLEAVQARIDSLMAWHPGLQTAQIPADWVTASGSGLDPHISLAAARLQAGRVAQARGLTEAQLLKLIEAQHEKPWLGIFGPSKIHVLSLNLALDRL